MKKITAALLCVFVLLAFTGCGKDTQKTGDYSFHSDSAESNSSRDDASQNGTDSRQDGESKILVAYFSRVGNTDFPDGIDAVASASLIVKGSELYGNTQYIATLIQRATDGELFLIETEDKYPADYDAADRRGAKESKEKSRPKLASHVEKMDGYDIVYLGFPNWYYGMPMAVYSFLEEYDLSGKIIIPFVTSGGSGFSNAISEIQNIQPDAAVLLLLMTYELIGQVSHELLGAVMFVLFVLHHILNSGWTKNLIKGRYTALRILQTVLVVLVLFSMAGSMLSGVMLSRHIFSFLSFGSGLLFARNLHMLSAYWGFVFMSLHLGFHCNMMMGMAKRLTKNPSAMRTWALRSIAALIAGYGVNAFVKRGIGSYLLLQNQFAFFDFEEPILQFLLDYIVVMGLFIAMGHYICGTIRKFKGVKKQEKQKGRSS